MVLIKLYREIKIIKNYKSNGIIEITKNKLIFYKISCV